MTQDSKIQLGQKVRDSLTGVEGTAIGITEWLYGCRRIIIQPYGEKDGKPFEAFTADEPGVEVVAERTAPPAPEPRRHGPAPTPERREGAARRTT